MRVPDNGRHMPSTNPPPSPATPEFERRRILVVDDDETSRAILENIFFHSFSVIHAEDGLDGLRKLQAHRHEICAVILDVMMPKLDGLGVLEKLFLADVVKEIPVFLITGRTDTEVWKSAYELGAVDVITKPFVSTIVQRRVTSQIELFRSHRRLSATVSESEERIRAQEAQIARLGIGMVEALASVIDSRSGESGEHVRRIRDITTLLLNTSYGDGLTSETKKAIAFAAMLHDVGKVAIPDAILNKPGRLTAEEYDVMKTHTLRGREMLEKIPQMRELSIYRYACDIAAYHHERWDGRGYPEGLAGDDIPRWAQAVSIADVYDALVSVRCYKAAFTHEEALAMIREGKCGTFSPELLDSFFRAADAIRALYRRDEGAAEF